MANVIVLRKQYSTLLDEVYKLSSLTAVLDGPNELVKEGANANEILIPKLSMQGLADYNKSTGYVAGDVTLDYETKKCAYDRGRMFNVDAMDNIESAGIAFGRLSGEFLRTQVVPELDAYRLASYAQIPGVTTAKAALATEIGNRRAQIDKDIARMQEQIAALSAEKNGLKEKLADKTALYDKEYEASVSKYDAEIEAYREFRDREPQDVTELVAQAAEIEEMKSHINEYRRMLSLQSDVDGLREETEELTRKIEKARMLPGEILQECKIPIAGLTVKDGVPLINGLPVSNLSDGEKLDLCIDVAIQNPKGLQIILIDGVEKLSTEWKNRLYDKCREKGLQFIATRTTDDAEMTVYEL